MQYDLILLCDVVLHISLNAAVPQHYQHDLSVRQWSANIPPRSTALEEESGVPQFRRGVRANQSICRCIAAAVYQSRLLSGSIRSPRVLDYRTNSPYQAAFQCEPETSSASPTRSASYSWLPCPPGPERAWHSVMPRHRTIGLKIVNDMLPVAIGHSCCTFDLSLTVL